MSRGIGDRKRSARSRSLVGKPGTSAVDVRAYLERHPNFLEDNPELLEMLTPPELHGGPVVSDFQRFQVLRLQKILSDLGSHQSRLADRARSNLTNQKNIHQAALSILAAEYLSELLHRVARDWPFTLCVDALAIGYATGGEAGRAPAADLVRLAPDCTDRLIREPEAGSLRCA